MQEIRGSAAILGVIMVAFSARGVGAQAVSPPDSNPPQTGEARAGSQRGAYAGMGRVLGEVTAVTGATVTLKSEDGSAVQVVTTDNTRVMKDRGPIKVSDLQVGDGLMAMGNMDAPNKTLHAAVIFAQDAAQVKAMRENLGKTYITGRVTAIDLDNAKMTVERADHVSQTIGFDDTTSFKRAVRGAAGGGGNGTSTARAAGEPGGSGRDGARAGAGGGLGMGGMAMGAGMDRAFANGESITLSDIKVGDLIAGTGAVKNGTFVPTRVVDSPPRPRRQHDGGTPGADAPAAASGSPASPGPGQR